MEQGWIKLHRKILDNGIIKKDPCAYIVFSVLLLSANRDTGTVEIGRFMLRDMTGIKPTTCYQALKRLEEKWEIVTQESNNRFTKVFIKNWHKYQDNEKQNDTTQRQQIDNRMTQPLTPLNKEDKNKELRIKNKILAANAAVAKNFNFQEYLQSMKTNTDKRIQVIALYWFVKKWTFENLESAQTEVRRSLRVAGDLVGYKFAKLREVMEWLESNADFKWTLETVPKYINENLEKITSSAKESFKKY